MGNGYSWAGMTLGMVGMLLFWVLLIVAIVMLIRYASGRDNSSNRRQKETALDILKKRYACGEIEREEFEQKRHDLGE